jgi:hypothetical protein
MCDATDMLIPILFDAEPGPADAVLVEGGKDMPGSGHAVRFTLGLAGHALGCACCTSRSPVADALGRLFRDRATGAAPFFPRVVVLASPAGEAAVRIAVAEDLVTRARYRLQAGG